MKYENCSKRCVVDYFQYYKQSYDEVEIDYISFNVPNQKFGVYIYFDHPIRLDDGVHTNIALVYSQDTLKKYGRAMPILRLPLREYPLDVTKMDQLYEKISTLSLFV